ncbi:MAG: type IV pilus assembly protein PilM [Pirellulaceae bacterium]|nr:type IV pilus assembly protein PilM [Pirellulaceae bacterium]
MAKKSGVWGIDIGQCGLKALFCTNEGGQMVAEHFDYIEYPKILTQPDADPEALVREAMDQFLARNDIKGYKLALSVPGQAGLARFFKPPPVEAKKIPEIVRYEARQQIPFDLDEVIWDFQTMAGGQEVDGFVLDAEVGLFAMKRDQVYKAINPFLDAGLEMDVVQLAPLSIYNFVAHDLMQDGPDIDLYDPDDPPDSIVVLSMGTESSDLVITNGFRVWQRSIPLGGNHFTKQLTKELKLTFAKAEHLKRNARQAEDPKTVFQAMRPIFNDLVTEVQRSVGFFQNLDRQAKISKVVILGNTVKLPGLQHYLSKNLGYEVVDFKRFNTLEGDDVISAPTFKENSLGFGVCYGLCLQGLGESRLRTNLVPREIIVNRMIREKKPWTVAALGSLLLAYTGYFYFPSSEAYHVKEDRTHNGVSWTTAGGDVDLLKTTSDDEVDKDDKKKKRIAQLAALGEEVVGAADRRLLWLEFLKALNAALPTTEGLAPGAIVAYKDMPYDKRKDLFIDYVESEYIEDLNASWYVAGGIADKLEQARARAERGETGAETLPPEEGEAPPAEGAAAEDDAAKTPADGSPTEPAAASDETSGDEGGDATATPAPAPVPAAGDVTAEPAEKGPEGAGWVIEMRGFHYYNSDPQVNGVAHVNETLLEWLANGEIELPIRAGHPEMMKFKLSDLGIGYAVVITNEGIVHDHTIPNPDGEPGAGEAGSSDSGGGDAGGGSDGVPGGFPGSGGGIPGSAGSGGFPGSAGSGGGFPGSAGSGGPGGFGPSSGSGGGVGGTTGASKSDIRVPKYSFTVQFCWQQKLLSKRLEEKREAEYQRQQELKAKQALEGAEGNVTEGGAE